LKWSSFSLKKNACMALLIEAGHVFHEAYKGEEEKLRNSQEE
jgi:hypothetical protein